PSIGAAAPAGAGRTIITDAAGRGSAGTAAVSGIIYLYSTGGDINARGRPRRDVWPLRGRLVAEDRRRRQRDAREGREAARRVRLAPSRRGGRAVPGRGRPAAHAAARRRPRRRTGSVHHRAARGRA